MQRWRMAVMAWNIPALMFLFTAFPTRVRAADVESIPAAVRVVRMEDYGMLKNDPLIHVRDGGVSGIWRGKSYWLFGDTVITRPSDSGLNWLSNTIAVAELPPSDDAGMAEGAGKAFDLCDVAMVEISGRMDPPSESIPWTAEESEYNAAHFTDRVAGEDRKRFAIWPCALVAAPDDSSSVIFFTRLMAGADGPFDFHTVGRTVAVWRDPDALPERPEADLFPDGDISLGDAACRVGDMVYVYGLQSKPLSWPTVVGRVPYERVTQRDAWEFYAGRDADGVTRWSSEATDAEPVLESSPQLSVHWNAAAECFIAVYTSPLANHLMLRTAPSPEGPWSDVVEIGECQPTTFPIGCYAGLAHPEFAEQDGLVEYVTYYRETGVFRGEIRVVRVTLERVGSQEPETKGS